MLIVYKLIGQVEVKVATRFMSGPLLVSNRTVTVLVTPPLLQPRPKNRGVVDMSRPELQAPPEIVRGFAYRPFLNYTHGRRTHPQYYGDIEAKKYTNKCVSIFISD